MQLTAALLATLLPTTLASYVFQNALTNDYLYLNVDPFVKTYARAAPLEEIKKSEWSHMYFDLIAVDDAYRIVDSDSGLVLHGVAGIGSSVGSPVIALMIEQPTTMALWHLSTSNTEAGYVTHKVTANKMATIGKGPIKEVKIVARAVADGLATGKWLIRKADELVLL